RDGFELSGPVRLDSGMTAPAPLVVIRGLAMVRLSGGETPVLRQSGDELPVGAVILKGNLEGTSREDRGDRSEWVSEMLGRALEFERKQSEAERARIHLFLFALALFAAALAVFTGGMAPAGMRLPLELDP